MEYNFLASFSEISSYIGYILLAILVLLVMITVHELGHYLVGKALKFSIDEFAVGFGTPLIKKRLKNGELFSLRLMSASRQPWLRIASISSLQESQV